MPALNQATANSHYSMGVILVLSAGVCWSFVPLGIRGFQSADVWQILFYRSLGVLPLVYWLCARHYGWNPLEGVRNKGSSCVLGALGLVAAYAGSIGSILLTSVANAAFLFATAPFFAALLARVFLGEAIRGATVMALLLALSGIFIMVYDSFSQGNWLGDLLALLSAIGFAVFATSLRSGDSSNSLPVVLLGATFAVILALFMSLTTGQGIAIPWREIALGLAIGAFVLGTGMILVSKGSRHVPTAELTLLSMTEIILAPVWAWLFLHELPTFAALIGGTIVVAAITLNAISGMRCRQALVG